MKDLSSGLSDLGSFLLYILRNPTFDLKAALLVYGVIALLLLVVLVVGVMLMMGPSQSRGGASLSNGPATGSARARRAKTLRLSSRSRVALAGVSLMVLLAAWVIAGYTTSDPGLCKSCHWPAASHATALKGSDPHAGTACISCHERGGVLGRYFLGVPARLVHFADAQSSSPLEQGYGQVTVSACSSCHRRALHGVTVNEARGLKVSHKEPLAASATCIDCHSLRGGVVGVHNAGMAACLRCHDAVQASTKCATCHDGTASAARPRATSFAQVQIPDVSCGGCHDEARECDGCHGMRMPHTTEFKAYAHARAGAADIWFNGGRSCSRCHTASRRSCQQCHTSSFGAAHGTRLGSGHTGATASACNTCHLRFAYSSTRDFCRDICHTPAAIAGSPR